MSGRRTELLRAARCRAGSTGASGGAALLRANWSTCKVSAHPLHASACSPDRSLPMQSTKSGGSPAAAASCRMRSTIRPLLTPWAREGWLMHNECEHSAQINAQNAVGNRCKGRPPARRHQPRSQPRLPYQARIHTHTCGLTSTIVWPGTTCRHSGGRGASA